MPDIDAIMRGEDVNLPKEIDLQYAVESSLVGRAIRARGDGNSQEVWGYILESALNFPQREMVVMLVSDMHRAVGEEMFTVPQFATWAKDIADVMLYNSN